MNYPPEESFSLRPADYPGISTAQKCFIALGCTGLVVAVLNINGQFLSNSLSLWLATGLVSISIIGYAYGLYHGKQAGIKNDHVFSAALTNRGVIAWLLTLVITAFYILLYFYPSVLGYKDSGNTGLIGLFDPFSQWIRLKPATQWFVYGCLYTIAILLFGIKFLLKYRGNRYQQLRTLSVMFFQLCFAFIIPEILERLNQPAMDLKNMWPLNYYFFFDWHLDQLRAAGNPGLIMLIWGVLMILVISPVLTYFYGKRWYCSWVCGCGGLAETAGDPFRHLSDTSQSAWRIERWVLYPILAFVLLMTAAVLWTYMTGQETIFFLSSYTIREWYGFLIGAVFSGVIGVGFYPILGPRVWCRFGCPMASILGIQQKYFSRFRITTNGGQCISCGNCSTYCEMGIDVRHYAQQGKNIVRASCVGCGICADVCPRGVLKLENGSVDLHSKTEQR